MSTNLQQQYDLVVDYIIGYYDFVNRMSLRNARAAYTSVRESIHTLRRLRQYWRDPNPLRNRTPGWLIDLVKANATEDEKENEYFDAVTSEYPVDALSNNLLSKFREVDFLQLRQLHDEKEAGLPSSPKPLAFLGSALGIIGFGLAVALNYVPKWVVVDRFDVAYRSFQVWVLIIAGGAILFICLVLAMSWWLSSRYRRAQRTHRSVGAVLKYVANKTQESE